VLKMAENFKNLDNILRDWGKIKHKNVLIRHWTGAKVWKKKDLNVLSRQSSEIKTDKNLILNLL